MQVFGKHQLQFGGELHLEFLNSLIDHNGTGNTLDNTITGNGGANFLDGGLGIDTLAGGGGNDTYVVDESADVVIEQAGAGTDSVLASASYVLSDNIENLTLTGTAAISGTGNSLANTITGNDGDNILFGLEGDDILNGSAGNDLLDGGAGADDMAGGTGDDAYIVYEAGDLVTELEGEGTDTVHSGISYTGAYGRLDSADRPPATGPNLRQPLQLESCHAPRSENS